MSFFSFSSCPGFLFILRIVMYYFGCFFIHRLGFALVPWPSDFEVNYFPGFEPS
ncbi:hypothetical protein B0F90DRAFT_1764027 [Multifurca ochricompacta]|uniref:Uncharacterized protein n=1 Tax=Multifurca ochricompacta TaxID=376703 RepID=A0AAD4LWR3_9AGAM|nr:hypothetical protein B0F90DRAFT_1764027 [Multifurca ochricompacta]